jgi:hypothetical protein
MSKNRLNLTLSPSGNLWRTTGETFAVLCEHILPKDKRLERPEKLVLFVSLKPSKKKGEMSGLFDGGEFLFEGESQYLTVPTRRIIGLLLGKDLSRSSDFSGRIYFRAIFPLPAVENPLSS